MITATHHGNNLVYAIAGQDKYNLSNAFIHGMESATRNEFFDMLSEARKCAELLNNPKRGDNDTKHKNPIDGTRSLKDWHYEVAYYKEK